jgi:uncharacterized protein YbjT (DUF2867 family)
MTSESRNWDERVTLVLGGSGRTGALVAGQLIDHGAPVRTASRRGSDVTFDWDDPATYLLALKDVGAVYLVPPALRARYADQVSAFLDQAEIAGTHHVTLLSTYNGHRAPQEVDVAAVETHLARRTRLTSTILQPAWVMQNFTDDHLPIIDGALTVPSSGGTEAFVDAADIAAVAVQTLLQPAAHAGARYELTGPQALTFDDVAQIISTVTGQSITHHDIDQEAWIRAALAAGVPADYAAMLRWLTGAIIAGNGSTPTPAIQAVLGRPATPLADFARRNTGAWTTGTDR